MLTDNILDLIGNTPLVQLRGERIFAKAEYLNPGGSIKDRVAVAMLEGAERDGKLSADSIIVEPTSGNTGIGIALVGRLKGYQVKIVMPENMSVERKKLIQALGAELPFFIEYEISETEPGVKGDTVSGSGKPATVETGAVVQVPFFIEVGDIIKVDTRSGEYLERMKK